MKKIVFVLVDDMGKVDLDFDDSFLCFDSALKFEALNNGLFKAELKHILHCFFIMGFYEIYYSENEIYLKDKRGLFNLSSLDVAVKRKAEEYLKLLAWSMSNHFSDNGKCKEVGCFGERVSCCGCSNPDCPSHKKWKKINGSLKI